MIINSKKDKALNSKISPRPTWHLARFPWLPPQQPKTCSQSTTTKHREPTQERHRPVLPYWSKLEPPSRANSSELAHAAGKEWRHQTNSRWATTRRWIGSATKVSHHKVPHSPQISGLSNSLTRKSSKSRVLLSLCTNPVRLLAASKSWVVVRPNTSQMLAVLQATRTISMAKALITTLKRHPAAILPLHMLLIYTSRNKRTSPSLLPWIRKTPFFRCSSNLNSEI